MDRNGVCLLEDDRGFVWQLEVLGDEVLLSCEMMKISDQDGNSAISLLDFNLNLNKTKGAWFSRNASSGMDLLCICRPIIYLDEYSFESLLLGFMKSSADIKEELEFQLSKKAGAKEKEVSRPNFASFV
ncbi:CesT family type III secretion system chaperone [Hahella aquimaris]|uniref:CesT family type III secretion system chaperone n=1 Tax=Hahella sp. HNIBRBA332 TaxID=3015983 RepID=UPI00273BB780|nr:CesT family type III secretion system chaperone [Hahella sp. HNIBRBA332]WLQ15164.1 CesT family type III secretion system chaperone [Hahella sp. HNIBRBA332]